MRFRGLFAVLLLSAAPLRAAPVKDSKVVLAGEAHLRAWILADASIQEKVARAQASSFVEPGLKDAVSDRPAPAPRQQDCPSLQRCSVPPLAMNIPAGEPAESAIMAMMMPWLRLADAKGVRLGVAHGDSGSRTLLTMNAPGLGFAGVELKVAPRPNGGVQLKFSRADELATAYSRERDALVDDAPNTQARLN